MKKHLNENRVMGEIRQELFIMKNNTEKKKTMGFNFDLAITSKNTGNL